MFQVTSNRETSQVSERTVDVSPTIYLVDPDDRHCDSVSSLMGRLGYRTERYMSAEDVLQALGRPARRGCVISEMKLPGMSGLDLYSELRERHVELPFIILTNESDVGQAVDALHRKVSDYVVKPAVERDLVTRVRDALRTLDDGRVKALS